MVYVYGHMLTMGSMSARLANLYNGWSKNFMMGEYIRHMYDRLLVLSLICNITT